MKIAKTARRLAAGTLILVAGLSAVIPAAKADDVTFVMRNNHPFRVQVELYSQDRDHVWPGDDQAYILDDGEAKEISLSCEAGEEICYGAWLDGDVGTYWGVGSGGEQTCDDCCYVCEGGETEEINLVE